jgi:hypothetical protein
VAREGGGCQCSLFFLYVEGGWEGEGVDFFRQIHYGGGGLVESSHFQNKRLRLGLDSLVFFFLFECHHYHLLNRL